MRLGYYRLQTRAQHATGAVKSVTPKISRHGSFETDHAVAIFGASPLQ